MDQTYLVAHFQLEQPCINILTTGVEGSPLTSAARPLSLLSLSTRQAVDSAVLRGLCCQRFRADITLDCPAMPPSGARLASAGLLLHILPERKQCFPECSLLEKELPCPLVDGVRFASVEVPGRLCLGDVLVPIHTS
jgi:hypothetical protein